MPAMIKTNQMPFQHWSETDVVGTPMVEKTNQIMCFGELLRFW
jgi:hypothetical protein